METSQTKKGRGGRKSEHPNRVDPDTGLTMKYCRTCHEYKPIDEFPLNRTHKDGHGSECRICHNKATLENQRRRRAQMKEALEAESKRMGEAAAAEAAQQAPAAKPSLSSFTDRELADELHARGWSGTLAKNLNVQ